MNEELIFFCDILISVNEYYRDQATLGILSFDTFLKPVMVHRKCSMQSIDFLQFSFQHQQFY